MPTPINFSVAPALRTGVAETAVTTYPGGYANLTFQLDGLGTGPGSDYENPANHAALTFFYSLDAGVTWLVFNRFTWVGGPVNRHGVIDPTPIGSIPLANLPAGCRVKAGVDLGSTTFTVGLSGTLS